MKGANSKKVPLKEDFPQQQQQLPPISVAEEEKATHIAPPLQQQPLSSNIATAFNINQFDNEEHCLPKSKYDHSCL
jgi:hypothetical protein